MFENFMTILRAFLASFTWNSGNNAKYLAEVQDKDVVAITTTNPMAHLFRWFLCQPAQEVQPLLSPRHVVEIAVLIWHGQKKHYTPYVWAVSWKADTFGLPENVRSIRIQPLGEYDGLGDMPTICLGKVENKADCSAKDHQNFAESIVKLFVLSGGGLNDNPIQNESINIRLNHSGLTEDDRDHIMAFVKIKKSNGCHDWEPSPENLIVGEDNVAEYFAQNCAPPSKEARLAQENRGLKNTLANQANELADLRAQMAQLMAMIQANNNT